MKRLIATLLYIASSWAGISQQSTGAVISAFSGHPTQDRHLTPHLLEIAKHGHELNWKQSVLISITPLYPEAPPSVQKQWDWISILTMESSVFISPPREGMQ